MIAGNPLYLEPLFLYNYCHIKQANCCCNFRSHWKTVVRIPQKRHGIKK